LPFGVFDFLFDCPDLIRKIEIGAGGGLHKVIQLFLQIKERLFEI
jgi:hypothetical protein